MSTEREQEEALTEAEAEAVVKAMTHGGYRCEPHLIRVVSRIVAAHEAAARAEAIDQFLIKVERRACNGAGDPGQQFYDWGLNPWLADIARSTL